MFFKILILLSLINLITSYDTVKCEIVGYHIEVEKEFSNGGSHDVYYPLWQINLFLGEEILLFNQSSPIARLNQYKNESYVLTRWESEQIAYKYFKREPKVDTCYYENIVNIYLTEPPRETTLGEKIFKIILIMILVPLYAIAAVNF